MNPLRSLAQGNGSNNNMLSAFLNFAKGFNGDPNAKIQELINSGKVSQEQYNAAVTQAKQLEPLVRGILGK